MKNKKNVLIWIAIFCSFYGVYEVFFNKKTSHNRTPLNKFYEDLDSNSIQKATVTPTSVVYKTQSDNPTIVAITPYYTNIVIEKLLDKKIETDINIQDRGLGFWRFILSLLSWLPTILFLGFWFYLFKKTSDPSGKNSSPTKLFGFSKSKAKMVLPQDIKVKFNDVAGIDEAKAELFEIVEFLKEPKKYAKIGAKIPKGCLLFGSPGTGKTLLAKAIAGEAGVPFFSVSGSDFVEMFVGVGASRVRELFSDAKAKAPCIIFIDEIDAVGRHRGSGVGGGNDEREQTLNQLLVEMDGFEENIGIVVIAATNRPDVLDKALMRPGRFDRQITISKPDLPGREKILAVHLRKVKLAPDVDIKRIARSTPGFSGADLANIVNEAALIAVKNNRLVATNLDFDLAKDKILMGLERSMVMKEDERKLTAYHEAGHAITSVYSPGSDPIHKATIIPRGRALGVVMRYPEEDRVSYTRQKMHADLVVAMGGRAAEFLVFGNDMVTSGASSDIRQVTALASAMVKEWGMSDKVGPVFHGQSDSNPYQKDMPSEEVNKLIDMEIKRLVDEALTEAMKILRDKWDEFDTLAKALLKYETLTGEEIKKVISGETLHKDSTFDDEVVESKNTQKDFWSLVNDLNNPVA
jgi:cell division protease FtsH